jgi:hypothetical protein
VAEPDARLFCSWHRTRATTVALPLPCNGLQWRRLALPLNLQAAHSEFFSYPFVGAKNADVIFQRFDLSLKRMT